MRVGDQIREAMLLRKISVSDLAKAIGVSNRTVRLWLSGEGSLSVRHAVAVERLLQVKLTITEGPCEGIWLRGISLVTAYPEVATMVQLEHEIRGAVVKVLRYIEQGGTRVKARVAVEALRRALTTISEQDRANCLGSPNR